MQQNRCDTEEDGYYFRLDKTISKRVAKAQTHISKEQGVQKIDTHTYGQLLKIPRQLNGEKTVFSTNGAGIIGSLQADF